MPRPKLACTSLGSPALLTARIISTNVGMRGRELSSTQRARALTPAAIDVFWGPEADSCPETLMATIVAHSR